MSTTTMMKEAIEALYPPRPTASRRRVRRLGSSSSSYGGSFNEKQFGRTPPHSSSSPYNTSPKKQRMGKSRFSELLLDHGEKDLHQDWAVCASSTDLSSGDTSNSNGGFCNGNLHGSCQMKQIEGRVRICSQSIVFEPHQSSRGIIRIPFRYVTYLGGSVDGASEVIIRCDRHFVMKTNNVIGPYEYIQSPVEFRFQFKHSSPNAMVSHAKQLFDVEASNKRLSSVSFAPSVAFDTSAPPIIPMPSSNKVNNETRNDIIEQIMGPAMNRPFDTTNFLHVQEQPLTPNLQCLIKTPLLEQRGCAILTEYGLYFQPLVISGLDHGAGSGISSGSMHSGASGKAAQVWSIDDMRAIARRYHGMKDVGLEIYLVKQHSILLAFESTEVRERVISIVSQQVSAMKSLPLPCFTDRSFVDSALELWQTGELDNFEYLLCLNSAAGRSFHDLSRYPVFPWVLSSYGEGNHDDDNYDLDDEVTPSKLDLSDASIYRDLSKPIGALNEERFEEFRKRYESMVEQKKTQPQHNEEPFMYGTHYSAPGYVLFYLLRVMPEHMLCLQNGKFDVPDRLFHSVEATYKSILVNNADVKELIPEWFDPDCFDFLINSMGLQLGNLQTGERVNDVLLPAWAKSAKHFLRQNRAALESDHCTENLTKWIDLIFGVTSRGQGAKEARNLFHPISYIGPENFEAIHSPDEKARAEFQASEFGICPDQLFCRKHPGRKESIGSWGDADTLLTKDRLRDSYGVGDNGVFGLSSSLEHVNLGERNPFV